MGDYYDRQGNPMGEEEWSRAAFKSDISDRVVKQETLPNGLFVSTVWVGTGRNYSGGPPLIFETAVFEDETLDRELDGDRYPTEGAAIAGHDQLVAKWRNRRGNQNDS